MKKINFHHLVPSCDCTAVEWEKHPVKPGESGEITTIYSPNSLGTFSRISKYTAM